MLNQFINLQKRKKINPKLKIFSISYQFFVDIFKINKKPSLNSPHYIKLFNTKNNCFSD